MDQGTQEPRDRPLVVGPPVGAITEAIKAELVAQLEERLARDPLPFEIGKRLLERHVVPQLGQEPIEQRIAHAGAESGGKLLGATNLDVPSRCVERNLLEMSVSLEDCRAGLGAPTGEATSAICAGPSPTRRPGPS